MHSHERYLMSKWVKGHLEKNPSHYWLRIPDGMHGGFRPFDGVLFMVQEAWAIEFKVERRKTFKFSLDELPKHQKEGLLEFENGEMRRSAVMVYHVATKTWHEFVVRKEKP